MKRRVTQPDRAGDAEDDTEAPSSDSASDVQLTLFVKNGGTCTKRISINGDKLVSDASECAMSSGEARRIPWSKIPHTSPLDPLVWLLTQVKSWQALALGRLNDGLPDRTPVTTERRRRQEPKSDLIARTLEYLSFKSGEQAFMLIDFDRKGMPDKVAQRITDSGGVWVVLVNAIPGLVNAARVKRASTSAGIYNKTTGEKFQSSGGEHHYVMVADGSDIPRCLRDLHDRLWLKGLGWYSIGSVGQLLERSIVDKTVGSPERLVFEGPPVLDPPLAQDQKAREPEATDGETIDTSVAIPPLAPAEREIVKSMKEQARRQMEPEAADIRARSARKMARQISEKTGLPIAKVLRQVEARYEGKLVPSMLLEFDDDELGIVSVREVLQEPDRFVGETLADPLEGIAYGRCKAKVMLRDDGELFIHSFAHGRTVYTLVIDGEMLRAKIEAAPRGMAVDVLIENLFLAHVESDELYSLLEFVAERTGLGPKEINARIKNAREMHAKKNAERRSATEPLDERVSVPAPAPNGEMTRVLEIIDNVLCGVGGDKPPMRDAYGNLCEIRERPVLGLHELMRDNAESKNRLPAPPEPLITRLDADHTSLLIERFIRFRRERKNGSVNERLHMPFARTYQTWSGSRLPRVVGVVTAPLVTESGLLIKNGLDRDRNLFFQIEPLLSRLMPTPSSISDADARSAWGFLRAKWLCDVQTDEEGKALVVLAALTLIERLLLPERPAFFITAGVRGGGKTTLMNMVSLAVLGRRASAAAWSENVEERRKALLAYFREGPAMIAWDNLPRGAGVSCPIVEKALTSPTIADRILGQSEQIIVPAATIQFFTGNNILPARDMASRSLVIQLRSDRPDPENRKFEHPDPFAWTLEQRASILSALYTLLVWNPYLRSDRVVRPQPKTRFKYWWTLCGAPIEAVTGIDLDVIFKARESDDTEASSVASLLVSLRGVYGEKSFTSSEVSTLSNGMGRPTDDPELIDIRALLEDATAKPFSRGCSLNGHNVGKRLQMIAGRPVQADGQVLTLERITDAKRGNRYRVTAS
jgi:hypothetical protein